MRSDLLTDDVAQGRDATQAQRNAQQQLLEDAKAVLMDTPAGRRVLWHLLEFCGVFSTTFTGNSQTFFKEGARSVGLHLLNITSLATAEGLSTLMEIGHERSSDQRGTE